jgi:hypothetical protein
MSHLVSLAWRNLWRQPRRTVLTLISIAFGGFLAILMTAMQDRSFADFIDNAARFGAGHVTLQHPEYRDTPTLGRTVQGVDALRTAAEADPRVLRVVERTSGNAMVSTARESFGAFFLAFDPERETPETMEITQGLVSGEPFRTASDDGGDPRPPPGVQPGRRARRQGRVHPHRPHGRDRGRHGAAARHREHRLGEHRRGARAAAARRGARGGRPRPRRSQPGGGLPARRATGGLGGRTVCARRPRTG